MNTEKIGKFISKKRKEKGMTQKELAGKIGVTDRAVSKWERGMGCPDVTLLEDLSKSLEISIVELLNGEEMEDQTIIEKDLIKSMSYSKEYTYTKIKNNLNVILVTIIICISILLIILNINNSYQLNVKNKTEINYSEQIEKTISNIDKYYSIILKNQGIYTDEEYKKIVSYVKKVKNLLSEEAERYLSKEKYSTKDYYEFIEYYNKVSTENYFNNNKSLYHILIKYDISTVDRMLDYQASTTRVSSISFKIRDEIKQSYEYDYENGKGLNIMWLIYTTYIKEEMLLKDIIEVGDMNE